MFVILPGRPTLVYPCIGVHNRGSSTISSELLQQYALSQIHLNWKVCKIGGRRLNSYSFSGVLLSIFLQNCRKHSWIVSSYFSLSVSLESKECNYTVVLTELQLGRNLVFVYQRSDFYMMDSLLIAVYVFSRRMLIIFTHSSARAGYDTRSFFKRSLTGLNSEFSFS